MAYSYQELKKKTVAQLREIAKGIEHEAVKGYSQLNKEHLLVGLCKALGIDHRVHHVAAGIDKAKIKGQIKQIKKDRDALLASPDKDLKKLHVMRAKIHRLKRLLRKAMM
jgi:DNA-binding IclR family transcriptional regulator